MIVVLLNATKNILLNTQITIHVYSNKVCWNNSIHQCVFFSEIDA